MLFLFGLRLILIKFFFMYSDFLIDFWVFKVVVVVSVNIGVSGFWGVRDFNFFSFEKYFLNVVVDFFLDWVLKFLRIILNMDKIRNLNNKISKK